MATLVYHTGALGDFLTILPAIALWRADHPRDRMVLLGRPDPGLLGVEYGFFDEVRDVTSANYAPLFTPDAEWAGVEEFAPFSHALLFCSPDSPILSHIQRVIGRVLHQPPFPADAVHIVDYHLDLIRPLCAVSRKIPTPLLSIPDDGEERSGFVVALHPGSGSKKKNWPLNGYLDLCAWLKSIGARVVWILGPAERELELPQGEEVLREPTLSCLARRLSRCTLSVGNDSGTMHLAAAVGCPCVCLFGPSDPDIWRPWGPRVRILRSTPPCGPCHGRGALACAGDCMQAISTEQVRQEVQTLLDSTR